MTEEANEITPIIQSKRDLFRSEIRKKNNAQYLRQLRQRQTLNNEINNISQIEQLSQISIADQEICEQIIKLAKELNQQVQLLQQGSQSNEKLLDLLQNLAFFVSSECEEQIYLIFYYNIHIDIFELLNQQQNFNDIYKEYAMFIFNNIVSSKPEFWEPLLSPQYMKTLCQLFMEGFIQKNIPSLNYFVINIKFIYKKGLSGLINLCAEYQEPRISLIQQGIISHIIDNFQIQRDENILVDISKLIAILSLESQSFYDQTKSLIPIIDELYNMKFYKQNQIVILLNCAQSLYYLSYEEDYKIQEIIQMKNFLIVLKQAQQDPLEECLWASKILANCCSGTDEQISFLIDLGILDTLTFLFQKPLAVRREAAFALSNILGSLKDSNIIRALDHTQLIDIFFQQIKNECYVVKLQLYHALFNMVNRLCQMEQKYIINIMNKGLDQVLQNVLNCQAPDMQELVLESLKPLIALVQDNKLPLIDQLEKIGLKQKLFQLKFHPSQKISTLASILIENLYVQH